MNKATKFISGNEYNLSQLFGGDNKIVIPDLQRDYCWGDNAFVSSNDKKPRELVSDFVKNIIELYEENKSLKVTLGLIYGYEQPQNHIQICDGQQRLTTLFLLLGYINIKVGGKFNTYIISEKEMNDDYEPHLQYAIRESTLYFLSDLARKVFVEKTTSIGDIISSNWYFNEYKEDASIQSMIAALSTIDNYFDNYSGFDFFGFGDFVLNNLRVLYYDMENRQRGEETYVVINTTGEPLSATENIKPILLGDPKLSSEQTRKYSEQWELREDWFWKNRGDDKTADEGMQVFFLWYWQIGLIQENSWVNDKKLPLNTRDLFLNAPKKITENANELKLSIENYEKFRSLDNLDKYFKALEKLVEVISKHQNMQRVLLSIKKKKDSVTSLDTTSKVWNWLRNADLDIVLPLIVFMAEHDNINLLYPFTRRLRKNHYDGVWNKNENEQSRRGKNYMDWRYLVQIINQTTDDNLLTVDLESLNISKIQMVNIPVWYTDDEAQKTKLRNLLPIEEMEDNEFLMGDLWPLWYCDRQKVYTADDIMKRWNNLKKMCQTFYPEDAANIVQFANWFRLYRLATGLLVLRHINNCQWSFEGCYYSLKPNEPWWIEDRRIEPLLNSDTPTDYMRQIVKERIAPFIHRPNNHQELVVSWMTLKTIQAEIGGYLLNYWNDRAVSAFINIKENFIIPIDDFHWGNTICGYSYSYTIYPARSNDNWRIKSNLDSPITSIDFIPDFYNRSTNVISMETIEEGDEEVKKIIDIFLRDK
jgi:hypothetical protein